MEETLEQTRFGGDIATTRTAPDLRPRETAEAHRPLRIGRFTVLEELGRGGMGIVYTAYDPDLDRKVAVKVLRTAAERSQETSEGKARLLREAQAMARLSHPNVATIHEVGTVGDEVFLAMEFINGRTLKAWVADVAGPEGWTSVVQVYRQAGEGLAAAHRAGLIHRDFKPDNVLVDAGGRARVLDFGLARAEAQADSDDPETPMEVSGDLNTRLTMAGQVMGTPAYMAPEQFVGEDLDARSDQFSFCVALWEALYGERPFLGSTFVELRQRVLRGGPPEPPERVAVPAWLQRVLLRGLGRHRAERYDSMEELLDALDRDPRRRRRRLLAVGAAGVLALAGTWGAVSYVQGQIEQARASTTEPCTEPEAGLSGIWDAERKREIRDAFTQTKVGYAEGTWERVRTGLDDYAQRFTEAQLAVCRATAVDKTQPEGLRLVRQACLNRRLSELRAYTAVFARADPRVVQGAIAGIDALHDPDECRTVQTMRVEMPLPVDEEAAAQVVEHRQRLDDVMALITSSQRDEALEVAQQVVIKAEQLAYLPFIAEAQLKLGITLDKKGRYEQAVEAMGKALTAAEVGRHDAVAVDAWNEWLRAVGYHQGRHEIARASLPRLDAALLRLGDDPLRQAAAEKTRGTLAYAEGNPQGAVKHFEIGKQILERELGPEHSQTATLYQNLGAALTQVGRYDEAEQVLKRGLEIWSAHSGSRHPGLASIHETLGDLARGRGKTEQAVHHYEQSLELFMLAHDELHPELSRRYRDLGLAHGAAGRHEEAATWHRKALEAEVRRLDGPEPPFESSLALARALLASGQAKAAIAPLEAVLAHPRVDEAEPAVRFVLAQALWDSGGSRTRARAQALEARDAYRELGQAKAQGQVDAWLSTHRPG